jgi:hypothetical protein
VTTRGSAKKRGKRSSFDSAFGVKIRTGHSLRLARDDRGSIPRGLLNEFGLKVVVMISYAAWVFSH